MGHCLTRHPLPHHKSTANTLTTTRTLILIQSERPFVLPERVAFWLVRGCFSRTWCWLGGCSGRCVCVLRAVSLGSEKCLRLSRPRGRQIVWGIVKKYRASSNCLGALPKSMEVRRQNGLGHPNSHIWASLRSSREIRFLEQAVLARVIPNPKLAED